MDVDRSSSSGSSTSRRARLSIRAGNNPTDRLPFQHVPTVLRRAGFQVRILLPPREHAPAHVHVYHTGGVVAIDLPDGALPARIRSVSGMRDADIVLAVRLVEDHAEFLQAQWEAIHG